MTIHMAMMGIPSGYRILSPFSGTWSDTGLPTVTYGVRWYFETDGTGDEYRDQGADNNNLVLIYPSTLTNATWVRCTEVSGLTLTIGTAGTWQQINAQRIFGITRSLIESTYSIKFEFATDSGGTDIVATKTISGSVGRVV